MATEHSEGPSLQATALSAALTALQPIVALLLDAGININEFTRFVRWASVDEAASRQRRQGKKPSISRIAAATGLSRPEVSQLLTSPPPTSGLVDLAPRTSDKVYAAWHSDPDFLEPTGRPRPLAYSDTEHSFSDLVRKYVTDIPPRAMLKEMIASNVVHALEDGTYVPAVPTSQSSLSKRDAIAQFGAKVGALGSTLVRNLNAPERERLFEALVHVNDISNVHSAKVTKELARRCRTFSQSVERYLLDQSGGRPTPAAAPGEQTVGVIVAIIEQDPQTDIDR